MSLPGCGTPISICVLGKAGHLAPMLKKPWTKRSLPLVTSLDKLGKGLFAFTPTVAPIGIFTNDDRFKQLGLKVPQTFAPAAHRLPEGEGSRNGRRRPRRRRTRAMSCS